MEWSERVLRKWAQHMWIEMVGKFNVNEKFILLYIKVIADIKADGLAEESVGKLSDNEEVKEESEGKKERSVLQAKLTRLAIQIGYAGLDIFL